jgi:hypothetical protein
VIICPHCGHGLRDPDASQNKKIKCSCCQMTFEATTTDDCLREFLAGFNAIRGPSDHPTETGKPCPRCGGLYGCVCVPNVSPASSSGSCPICTMPLDQDGECIRHDHDEIAEWYRAHPPNSSIGGNPPIGTGKGDDK